MAEPACEPSPEAVEAAWRELPYNNILRGDLGRPLSREELAACLCAAYAADRVAPCRAGAVMEPIADQALRELAVSELKKHRASGPPLQRVVWEDDGAPD